MKLALISAAALGALLLGPAAQTAEPGATTAAPSAAAASTDPGDIVEPEALAALQRMGAYLRTLKSFEMNSEFSMDIEVDAQLLTFDGGTTYKARAPDKLFVEMSTDRKLRQVFYDGRKVTIYSPRMKYYASLEAPPTIRETLQMAEDKYDVVLPLSDLFYWGTPAARTEQLITGTYIGPAKCGDAICDHYAFEEQDLDWQIWIQKGEQPLPRKVVITTQLEDSQPRFAARLDWAVNPELADATFAFVPPSDSRAIPIAVASK